MHQVLQKEFATSRKTRSHGPTIPMKYT